MGKRTRNSRCQSAFVIAVDPTIPPALSNILQSTRFPDNTNFLLKQVSLINDANCRKLLFRCDIPCSISRNTRCAVQPILIISARAILPGYASRTSKNSLNSTIAADGCDAGDLKPKKLIFKERGRITIVTSAPGSFAWAHPIGFAPRRRYNPLVFLLTANKDEDAEQQRGAERPTGHPGVERYVDSASS